MILFTTLRAKRAASTFQNFAIIYNTNAFQYFSILRNASEYFQILCLLEEVLRSIAKSATYCNVNVVAR